MKSGGSEGRRGIVVFGINSWDSRWQRPQHMVKDFAERGHRVIYIDPFLATGGVDWTQLHETSCPLGVVLARLGSKSVPFVKHPQPWSEEDIGHINLTLRHLLQELEVAAPILFVQAPGWWPLVGVLRSKTDSPIVYDCLDEHTAWEFEVSELMRAYELELARKADLVLATSRALAHRMRELAESVVEVPNGCDYQHFAQARKPNGVLRSSLAGPILGFHGLIGPDWFDVELVGAVAALRPRWNIVLVGPAIGGADQKLHQYSNIHQLGEVPYSELPRYCADVDVSLLPFRLTDLTIPADPIKIYEYFAAGKPVVATPLPQVRRFGNLVELAESPKEFVAAIEYLLAEPGDASARQAVARESTWERRVAGFYEEMLRL